MHINQLSLQLSLLYLARYHLTKKSPQQPQLRRFSFCSPEKALRLSPALLKKTTTMASASEGSGITTKPIGPVARIFIIAAYKFGLSTQLIQRSLRESSYNPTLEDIRTVLAQNEILDDGSNCTQQSHVWKRYLTFIASKVEPTSLAQFKREVLNDAITFYDIDEEIINKYWLELIEFQAGAPFGSRYHPDFERRFGPWIVSAFLEFGYNIHSLSYFLEKNGFSIPRGTIGKIFNDVAEYTNLDKELVRKLGPGTIIYPVVHALSTKEFWKAGYALSGDAGIPRMRELSEVVGGCRADMRNIRNGY